MEQTTTQNHSSDLNLIFKENNFRFLNSGKLGLSLILNYLREFENFNPKYDEVFVPKYMGQWIYSSLNQNCVVSPKFTENTKVIYLYHQFGVPQKFKDLEILAKEKKIFLVEDCAHVIFGKNRDFEIGKIGDFSIFSFSKFINCFLLGGICSKKQNFFKYIDNELSKSSKIQSLFNYFLLRYANILSDKSPLKKRLFSINYSLYNYPSKHLKFIEKNFKKLIKSEIELRLKRFSLAKQLLNHKKSMDFLSYDNLVLYKFPLAFDKKTIDNLILEFDKNKFKYELLQYDYNRNMLNPNYQKTLIIDVGQKNKFFEKQLDIVLKYIHE